MEFKPSTYQQAVYDVIEHGNGSLIVNAVAGSGKTTTIVNSVELLSDSLTTMFCAFNKSIATELGNRLPKHVNTCTMNSLGHRAWMRHVGGRIDLKVDKTYRIFDSEQIQTEFSHKSPRSVRYVVSQLVGFAKGLGLVPAELEGKGYTGLLADTTKSWEGIIQHYGVDMNIKRDGKTRFEVKQELREKTDLAIEIARRILYIGIKNQKLIDFNDQLYLPVIANARFPANDVVFVDEAQDISAIQRVMLKRSLKHGGRLIAVGDPHQAIYGFRGADSESLNNIAKDFNANSLPLSISYRCPQDIVKEAQSFVSHIEASDTAPMGKVEQLGTYSNTNMDTFQPEDFVLCRNVAPLIKLAFALIRAQKPVGILGRDIGKTIVSLIEKLNANDITDLELKLSQWEQIEISRIQERDPEANVGYIIERADAVRTFITCSHEHTIEGVIDAVGRLFCNSISGAVKLATIHKSKGLEAERVIILDQHLIPSKYATQEWQKEQENNLNYVAITRSMGYLGYIESPDD